MGACSIERTGPLTLIRFSARSEVGNAAWPAAIVVWRGTASLPDRGWRAKWRRFLYRRGFDPLHAPFTMGRDAGLWLGTAGPEGERETLFHTRRRVVRVVDREFPLKPPGETIVLLIDDSDPSRDPKLISRVVQGEVEALETGVAISTRYSVETFSDPTDPLMLLARLDPEVRVFFASGT